MNKKIDLKKKQEYYSTALPLKVTFTDKKHKEFKTLHFRWIENAMSRCVFHGLFCEPGTVITISHAVSSMWIASIKIKVGGKFDIDSIWDQKEVVGELMKPSQEKESAKSSSSRQRNDPLRTDVSGRATTGTSRTRSSAGTIH